MTRFDMMTQTKAPRFIFRFDVSPDLGTGHLRRCLALMAELRRQGAEISVLGRVADYPLALELSPVTREVRELTWDTTPADDAQALLAACHDWRADAVVLPYRSATGTGVVPLAYRYGRPVVASRIGGFTDVVEEGVSGLFFNPGDPRSLAASIRELLSNPQRLQTGAAKAAGRMTWEGLASCILRLVGEEPTGG